MDALIPGDVNPDRGGPAQPLLLAKNLRKHFPIMGGLLGRTTKVVRAVDDLSLSVAKGETLGVVVQTPIMVVYTPRSRADSANPQSPPDAEHGEELLRPRL